MKTPLERILPKGIITVLALPFGCPHLHAQSADDHGNTPGTASVLALDAAGSASGSGAIQTTGDADWFRTAMPGQSTGVFTLTGAPGQTLQLHIASAPAAVWKSGAIPAGGTRVVLANILPTGAFFARVGGTTGNYTLAIASRVSGDTNADRKSDVLWQHSTTGQMSVWHMNGRTRLGGDEFPARPAAGWKLVNTGDFNTDRTPDLVLQNASNGDVVLWYMNGLGLLSQGPLNIQMGSKLWCVAATGDMNKDGMLDLLYQNTSTGNIQVRFLNRSRQVTGSGVFPQQLSPVFRLCGTGDVNGDGNPDAVWQNRNTGAVLATYLNGLTIVAGGGGLSAQPSFSWEVAGIEDRNGDGKADLLLQHRNTGQTLVWFLNGRTVLAGGGATNVQQPSSLFRAGNSRSLFAPPPDGFSFIPAGTFQMGDAMTSTGEGGTGELPIHPVHVSGFHMAKHEVTKELWDSVRVWGAANGYIDLPAGNGAYASKGANHPVHSITWQDMVKWCNARSQREGLVPCYYTDALQSSIHKTGTINLTNSMVKWNANGYRLPTEAEWEKAARGGLAGKRFPWGDTISHSRANYFSYYSVYGYDTVQTLGYHPSYAKGGIPYTSPVGSFPPNGYGIHDMAGNVHESCWDRFAAYASGTQIDPRGPDSGLPRVVRGGGWAGFAYVCRVSYRNYDGYNPSPESRANYGFRLARSAAP